MAKVATCPSCGARVQFRSPVSVMAVCDFCRSTLIRRDKQIRNIGRMAELLPDPSIIQLGTEGMYAGVHFAVIGRLQLKYDAGLWNEWHLLFDDMRSGWLSEAGGTCFVTFPQPLQEPISAERGKKIHPGERLLLNGKAYTVTNIDNATCIAGQGELPFQVGGGYELLSVDVRAEDGAAATLDFSQDPALLYSGEQVQLEQLRLANIKQALPEVPTLPAGSVKSFSCPRCAAPLTIHAECICNVACGSCGAIVDPNDAHLRIVADAAQMQKFDPILPLGSRGKLRDAEWEVIGFQVRQSVFDGLTYRWHEYLLFRTPGHFAWLIMSGGHWSFAQALDGIPRMAASIPVWKGESFKHFQAAKASVSYVVGEFYWQVQLNDTVVCTDYIAPPRMLSVEANEREVGWTLAEYIEPEEVALAFGIKKPLPAKVRVGANQPNPYQEANRAIWRVFRWLSLSAFILQLLFVFFMPQVKLFSELISLAPGDNETVEVRRFKLDKPVSNFVVHCHTNLDNSWAGISLFLSEETTGAEYAATQDLSYYYGSEDGESWHEGSRDETFRFGSLPPGKYLLQVDAESDPAVRSGVRAVLNAEHDKRGWLNYILAQIFLLLLPLYSWWRTKRFEIRRWADSDHPIITSVDDDD